MLVLLHMLEVAHRDNILTGGHKVEAQHPATSEMIKEGFLVHLLEQYFLKYMMSRDLC